MLAAGIRGRLLIQEGGRKRRQAEALVAPVLSFGSSSLVGLYSSFAAASMSY